MLMKLHPIKPIQALSILTLIILLSATSCQRDCVGTYTYYQYEPIYASIDQVRNGISVNGPTALKTPGKIYRYGTYLLISERGQGVHILDNSDPSSPVNLAFVQVPGAMDMAVRGNVLYIDSYMDLVTFNIADPVSPVFMDRDENVFSSWVLYNPDHQQATHEAWMEANRIVVGYNEKIVTSEVPCDGGGIYRGPELGGGFAQDNSASPGVTNDVGNGQGGSMARFTLYQDYLYAINSYEMYVFDLSDLMNPEKINTVEMGWGIETLYPYEDKLFVGAQSGMFIYDLSSPAYPTYISSYSHWTACDPVVVQGDIAYVTLRSTETACAGWQNQLDVLDISDIFNPHLLKTYEMEHPYGLGIDGTSLFICEGSAGLKVFETQDGINLSKTAHFEGMDAFDVIPDAVQDVLIMIGQDGIYQYDYSDPNNLRLLSTLHAK